MLIASKKKRAQPIVTANVRAGARPGLSLDVGRYKMTLFGYIWLTALAFALVILPAGYLGLCIWMLRKRAWWFTYLAWFCAFGSFGGWCLAFVISLGGPGGIVLSFGMELFLIFCAMVGCLASVAVLHFRKRKDQFDRGALLGSWAFVASHCAAFAAVVAIVIFH
jgi:hypothetical protein